MRTTGVSQCSHCSALVNIHWPSCLVCHALISPVAETRDAIQCGSFITWTRGDGTTQTGPVDFVHTDLDGIAWAFVTIEGSWIAVNMKFVNGLNA